jgi:hypothetical protein
MVYFGAIIGDSADWTKKALFKPFNFKKWLILTFIALMAGSMSNGCNFNTGGGGGDHHYEESQQKQGGGTGACETPPIVNRKSTGEDVAIMWVFLGAAILFIVVIMVLFTWLGSRFSFVFIDNIVKNDASVRKPFSDNADVGNSYFRFNIVFMLVFLASIAALIGLGIFICFGMGLFTALQAPEPSGKAIGEFLLVFIPFLLVFIMVTCAAGVFMTMLVDLVLPIMYKDRITTLGGIGKAWALVKANKGNFAVYLLIKIGLGIGAGIAYILAFIAGVIILLIPLVLIGVALYFLSMAIPATALLPYWIIVGVILTPVCVFLLFCLTALNLPFAVFFRSMSMKFLEKLDPQYALIPSEKQVAAQQ